MGTIQRQGILNTVIIYVGVALGFLNTIVVQPHLLQTDEVGLLRLLVNFSSLLTPFFLLGASSTCVRYFPEFRNAEKRHHGFLGLVLLIAAIGIFAGGILMWIFKDWIISRYIKESALFVHYYYWTFPLAVVMTVAIVINSYSNSHLKTVVPSFLSDIWIRILLIAFTLFYYFKWISFDFLVASIWITYFTQLIGILLYVLAIDKPSLKPDWNFVRQIGTSKIFRYSILLTLTALSSLSIKFLDSVMIGSFLPLRYVGIYAIGAFIAQFIETPLYSLERIAAAQVAHAYQKNDTGQIREIYYRSVRYLFLIAGFLVVCIITNINDFLLLLPPDYREAAGVTIIMSIGSLINMATGVNSPIINNSTKYIWSMYFLLILLVTSIALNLFLIPVYGIMGAAVATGLASVVFNLLKFGFIWKNFGMQPYDLRTLKTVLVIAISFSVVWFIPVPNSAIYAILVRGTVTAILYAVLTRVMNIVPEYHNKLNSIFRGRR